MPGHSRGGLIFVDRTNRMLFSTDVVYLRQLYLLNPDSSVSDYVASLDKLSTIVDQFDAVFPAHGPTPIEPSVIPKMAEGMRAIAMGRKPDKIDMEPSIEGGIADVTERTSLMVHDFGQFEVLVSSLAQR
jgi:glyoxylase-like metal-dependent hydrolase (beta-lactamase superfamily II)